MCFLQLLSRHSELEQSEIKAQGALVTILSLTQITELKLLLDLGRQGHRFYNLVLVMLIACISLEIFIGVIIIYIGNLHYYKTSTGVSFCSQLLSCITCNCVHPSKAGGRRGLIGSSGYVVGRESVRLSTRSGGGGRMDEEMMAAGFDPSSPEARIEAAFGDLDRTGANIEFARMKTADAGVKITKAGNYVGVVEEAFRKSPGNAELEKELNRAREELSAALREKEEAEAEQRLAEVQQHRLIMMKERQEDWQERLTFRKISLWQHAATYLLYVVLLLNVFITTFGISSGSLLDYPVVTTTPSPSPHFTSPMNATRH